MLLLFLTRILIRRCSSGPAIPPGISRLMAAGSFTGYLNRLMPLLISGSLATMTVTGKKLKSPLTGNFRAMVSLYMSTVIMNLLQRTPSRLIFPMITIQLVPIACFLPFRIAGVEWMSLSIWVRSSLPFISGSTDRRWATARIPKHRPNSKLRPTSSLVRTWLPCRFIAGQMVRISNARTCGEFRA